MWHDRDVVRPRIHRHHTGGLREVAHRVGADRAAASAMAAPSETSPVADCTSENTTSQVWSVIDSARAASGTVRTRRSGRCRNGNMIDEKSPSMQQHLGTRGHRRRDQ